MVSSAVNSAISLLTSTHSLFSFMVSEADLYFCEKAGRVAIKQMADRRNSTFLFIIIFKRVISQPGGFRLYDSSNKEGIVKV
jgi:hypothetical protein